MQAKLYTITEAAKVLHVSYGFLARKVVAKKINTVPMGKQKRITEFELNRIFDEGIE